MFTTLQTLSYHKNVMQAKALSAAAAIIATMIIGLPCRLLVIFLTLHLNFAMRMAAIKID